MPRLRRPLLALVLLAAAAAWAPAQDADELTTRTEKVRAWRNAQLSAMAKVAGAKGHGVLAQRCAQHAAALGWNAEEAKALSEMAQLTDLAGASEKQRAPLDAKWTAYREECAKRLADLARWSEKAGRAEAATAAAREAVRLDGACATARAVLGQAQVKGWGWVSAADAAQFKKGLLPLGGQWLPKGEAEKKATAWESAWQVDSDHWSIRSNLDLDRVFELRDLLEAYHTRFLEDWEGWLPLVDDPPRHVVHLFAKESEYRADLEANDPQHTKNVPGQYSPNLRRSVFYDVELHRTGSNQTSSTAELMLHECTHQLLRELVKSVATNTEAGDSANFWLHEGICEWYGMHAVEKGRLVFDPSHVRGLARTTHLKQNVGRMLSVPKLDTVPRSEFLSSDGQQRLTNYAQGGFLCLFLAGGEHRAALWRITREVYCERNVPGLLTKHLGANLDAVDKDFRASFAKF